MHDRKEITDMITLVFMIMALLTGVVMAAVRFAWGTTKFLFGLGLFCVCPALFVIIVLFGGFSHLWLPIVIIGLLFGRRFRLAM